MQRSAGPCEAAGTSLTAAGLATMLPRADTISLSHDLEFRRPVRIGNTIIPPLEVTGLMTEKNLVRLKTSCVNQRDEVVLEGTGAPLEPPE